MIQEDGIDRAIERAHFAHLQALFQEAMKRPPQERQAFVEKACAGDRDLLAELTGMMNADGGSSLLDHDVGAVAQQIFALTGSLDGVQIGPYRLIRLLGEGGMGVVYLAERTDTRNPVAIKFLRDAWLSPARRERFLSEQCMLAPLIHPSIARFYDAGTLDNGTPWFAMEYVEGIPINEYCRLHQSTLLERLELFRAVCEAVQYAHEHAVIHRDLKPSNILVNKEGAVRLLDFGIAKQISDLGSPVEQTQTFRMLTPAYAAPEQVRGDPVGIFTDVYALGIVLYELLTGARPSKASSCDSDEVGKSTVEADPEKPSTAARRIVTTGSPHLDASKSTWADLDVIALTAIQQEVQRRYRSVEALIRDVDHQLNGEPLEARTDSLTYRIRKFAGRNRRPISIAITVFIIIVVMAIFFTVRLAEARNAALTAALRTKRVQTFMLNLFEGGDKSGAPAENLSILTLLGRGVQEAQTLNRDPELRADLYETLGTVYEKLGKLDRADPLLHSALDQRKTLFGSDDPETAKALVDLGLLRVDEAKFQEGEQLIRDGMEKLKHALPPEPEGLAKATLALGKVLEARGNYSSAIPILNDAIRLESEARVSNPELAASLKELADAQFYAGHYDVCEALTHRVLGMHRQLYGDTHPAIAEDLINLGAVQIERGQYGVAEQFYRSALEIDRRWYGENHPQTASDLYMLGEALVSEKRFEEAERLLKQALAIQEHVYGTSHPHVANILNEECLVALGRNQLQQAELCFARVVQIYRAAYGNEHYRVALGLANLASVYLDKTEYLRAEQTFREAIDIYRRILPADHLYLGIAEVKLGRTLLRQKRYAQAEAYSLAGYSILTKQTSPSVSWLQSARTDLADIYDHLGQDDKAASFRAELAKVAKRARSRQW